jgi:methylmalonyl-CoA mutase N-terminal domain/subunit
MGTKSTTKESNSPKKVLTASGLDVQTVYGPAQKNEAKGPGEPGEYPYTRGIHADMYRGRLWTMRQYAGFGSASEANQRYRYLLSQGTTGLSVAFDLPTQMGYDPDSPAAKGEVGKVGVSIASVNDMQTLVEGIPLEEVSISMTINATAAIIFAFLLVVAERRKVPWDRLSGTVQNDILKEYIARGTYIFPPAHGLRLVTDLIEYSTTKVPRWNTISISGYHIREAGSTAVQELTYTFANAIAYVDAALGRNLKVDDFAPRLAFFFNCHNDFLEEICKFRAARRIWARIMKERFAAKDPKSMMLRFHVQTAGSSLTSQQPLNNVVRTSLQALAAVLGGTQSLHTNAFDEALALPSESSALLALRTQQIIAYESGVTSSVDPLGGSYLIEQWTDRIENQVLKALEKLDSDGGMLKAIERGEPQSEIEKAAYLYNQQIESGELIVVGVNKFVVDSPQDIETIRLDPAVEKERKKEVEAVRDSRDEASAAKAGAELQAALSRSDNLMPGIIGCARADLTLGEISAIMRERFGQYRGN